MTLGDRLRRVLPNHAGIVLATLGYFCFAFQDAAVKWLVADHSVPQLMFMRSVTILVLCLVLGRTALMRQVAHSPNKRALLLRAALILGAWACYYTAAREMQLAQLATIYFATPLLVTVLSVLILKEEVRWQRWVGVAVGFLGVVVASDPGRVGISWPVILVLIAAGLWGYSNILVRQISQRETTIAQMLFSNAIFTLVCGATLPWLWIPARPGELALMVTLGLTGAAGQYLLFEGFRLAAASLVAPFEYSSLVWAFCLSFLIWGDIPKAQVFIGAGLIIASGLLIIFGERRLKRVK
jgi:S-adenosylmethionine uptake transporter